MIRSNNIIKSTLLKWWQFFIYKPDSKNIYWEKIISSIVVLVGLVVLVFISVKNTNELDNKRKIHGRYTIGITTDYANNIRSSYTNIYFNYSVKQSILKGCSDYPYDWHNDINKEGGRYYVQFASNNPSNSEMLFEYPVPDSIKFAPDSGWSYMPGYENIKP